MTDAAPRPAQGAVMSVADKPLPNFVVAGAPRCGTSALFTYLAAHPQVAPSCVKEVQYFMDQDSALFRPEASYVRHGLARYHRFFARGLEEKPRAAVIFEATPGYMYQQTALGALATLPSQPKLLFQLRRPSEQIYSSYIYSLHQAGNLAQQLSFREFAFGSRELTASRSEFHRDALAFADYEAFLSKWRAACGEDRMRVTCFEDLRKDPRAYMEELALWLGIDPSFYAAYEFTVVNRNVAVRSRRFQKVARRLSARLPGSARAWARYCYRAVNTRSVFGPSPDERAVMAEIDKHMRAANSRLADAFGIDVRAWGEA